MLNCRSVTMGLEWINQRWIEFLSPILQPKRSVKGLVSGWRWSMVLFNVIKGLSLQTVNLAQEPGL